MIYAGAALARRLETAEARNDALCAEAHQRIDPRTRAAVLEVAGGVAIYAGRLSPLTHALGMGMQGLVPAAEIDRMEAFFAARGVGGTVDVCPLADASIFSLLASRGYRVFEFNNILARNLAGVEPASEDPRARPAAADEEILWSRTVARGFLEKDDLTPQEIDIGRSIWQMAGVRCYFGEKDGQPAAAAALAMHGGLALLFADCTVFSHRGAGLHAALIRRRLRDAVLAGCDMATASTLPGSVSQRNYERAGFQVLYTKPVLAKTQPQTHNP